MRMGRACPLLSLKLRNPVQKASRSITNTKHPLSKDDPEANSTD